MVVTRRPSIFDDFMSVPSPTPVNKVDGVVEEDEWDLGLENLEWDLKLRPKFSVDEAVDKIQTQLKNPVRIKQRDKFVFVLGASNISFTAFLLGAAPTMFYLWHTFKALTLIPFRYFSYKTANQHYFLLDFCYYANAFVLVYLYLVPTNVTLFRICFAFCSGPLAWSIAAFRNSLVMHSVDKMTSLHIHLSPCLVMWSLRWFGIPGRVICSPGVDCTSDWNVVGFLVYPTIAWFVWAAAYYYEIFRKPVKGTTLFSHLMSQKGVVHSFCIKFHEKYQPIAYLFTHFVFSVTLMIVGTVFWFSFHLHTLFLVVMTLVSTWNGASFYFDVFAKRYNSQIEKALETVRHGAQAG